MAKIIKSYKFPTGKRRFPDVPLWAERTIRQQPTKLLKYNLTKPMGRANRELTEYTINQRKRRK